MCRDPVDGVRIGLGPSGEEDAAYQGVIRLLREGRAIDAAVSAREYLRAFPEGLRRHELSRIARHPRGERPG